ncbi:MAG: hypothetical protein AAFR62_11695 [Cyanobacteria bacterium J06629_2]
MLNQVRKLLRDRSPDWLNTEVNKNLLQNLSAPLVKEGWGDLDRSPEQVKASLNKSKIATNQPLLTANCSLPTVKGTPHWRRIKLVFEVLDNAPANYTYNQLIEYVRATTGKGCSRKLISKWKKQRLDRNIPDNDSGDHSTEERTVAISASPTIVDIPSTVNCLHLTDSNSLSTDLSPNGDKCSPMTAKMWSYLAAAGITIALVGCEIIPFNNRPNENVAIASVTAPITPLTPIPERRKNRFEPRSIKIELTLSNPQDLKVKPGDKIGAGQVLSDRLSERNRLQAKKKQLQLSLEKLNLPLTPIPQPKPIPEIAKLPPVSYAEVEAAIKLKQQKLTVAERAIALQQKKIDSLTQLNAKPATDKDSKASPLLRGTEGDLKLILEHERTNLANLEVAKDSAQIQLEVAQSKLTTAKEQRAYIEYQRQLEQTRRAIAVEQQQQAIQRQESERERLLAEREYSKTQIEIQIQTLDYQIHQLSTVRAPYEGTIKKVKWTGQSDHNLTAVITLAVNSDRPTVAHNISKPAPDTEAKQSTQAQP